MNRLCPGFYMALSGFVLLVFSTQIRTVSGAGVASPRLIPLCASGLMLLFGCLNMIRTVIQNTKKGMTSNPGTMQGITVRVLVVGLLLAYTLLYEPLGYPIATLILLVALGYVYGLRKPVGLIALALITTASTWLVFSKLFGSYLPLGLLR